MNITYLSADPTKYEKGRRGNQPKYIIIHTVVGSLDSAVHEFQNVQNGRMVSAHYICGNDGRIAQSVKEEDTAYHAGNFSMNLQSIGIEHEDNAQPNSPRPDSLYETSAELIADICKRNNIPIAREFIRKHNEVPNPNDASKTVATSCPGTLDIDRLVSRAQQIAGGDSPKIVTPTVSTLTPYTRNVIISVAEGANVRKIPSVAGAIVKVLAKNTTISVQGFVTGDTVADNNIWYKLKDEESYVWAGTTSVPKPAVQPQDSVKPMPPVANQPVDSLTIDELKLQNNTLKTQNSLLVKKNEDLTKDNMRLKDALNAVQGENATYQAETKNMELLKRSNETLSQQIGIYQDKVKQLNSDLGKSYVKAFQQWNLFEVPKGLTSVVLISGIALKVLLLIFTVRKSDVVVGWKKDAKLLTVDQYESVYGKG